MALVCLSLRYGVNGSMCSLVYSILVLSPALLGTFCLRSVCIMLNLLNTGMELYLFYAWRLTCSESCTCSGVLDMFLHANFDVVASYQALVVWSILAIVGWENFLPYISQAADN